MKNGDNRNTSDTPKSGSPAPQSGEWTLVTSVGDRMIYEGTLSAACACLLADETVPPEPLGIRSYWVRRQDHAEALVLKLGRAFHIFTVVGLREHLPDLQRDVQTELILQGEFAACSR